MSRSKKRKAYFWGLVAEWLSILFLMGKGYRILARRFKCKAGEIDLITQKGQIICFVEVKARKSRIEAIESLSYHQQQRVIRAAEWYLAQKAQQRKDFSCRFDMMAVEPWRLPTHIKDAWQKEIRI